jgi:hypothetical protein
MNLKRFFKPWWGFFICSMVAIFWIFLDLAGDHSTRGQAFFLCALAAVNLWMAHGWYAAHEWQKAASEQMFNAIMEAERLSNERKV